MVESFKIQISGLVQGVGFRPFVHNLATENALTGTVSNNEFGVIIIISGVKKQCETFYNQLIQNPPPLAKIKQSSFDTIETQFFNSFSIIPSLKSGALNLPLTPDFAICEDCKKDIENPKNIRYNYPFTTCVNCGPRWAITQTFPFERNNTSIAEFVMCNACEQEYAQPTNRRFHSQTNTCATCGIDVFLTDNSGKKIDVLKNGLFKKIAFLLRQGAIIAIKNSSGYLMCCNAENQETVDRLRLKKNRPAKPFAVLYPSLKHLKKELALNSFHIKSLKSSERPITLVPLENYKGKIALKSVAPKLNQLGVMLPYTGILQLLANQLDFPIVATSGNIHGSPIISNNKEAIENLNTIADYFVQHNLKIAHPQDDSVIKYSFKFNKEVMFRRSRGYAPNYFDAPLKPQKTIMAMGSHLKSSITFYPNEFVYVSEYLGNLDNFDVYQRFSQTAAAFISIFEKQPQIVLVDKHPNYNSSIYGKELTQNLNCKLVEIQHHKAHFAAILAEHHLFDKRVLGVIFDGTGYGDNNAIWGGEFFSYNNNSINRINHLDYFDWILGDKMSKEPRISLLALANKKMFPVLQTKFSDNELQSYLYLLKKNQLKTSSVGRLFDAVASLLNISDYNSYEAEAPILLENSIKSYNLSKAINYLEKSNSFSAKTIIQGVYADKLAQKSLNDILTNFIFTLAKYIISEAEKNNFEHVALSGGIFQNTTLIDMLLELAPSKIKLYFHTNLAPNDENISFGQLMYYLHCNT